MKIALIGFGNMGQELERVIKSSDKHQVVSVSLESVDGVWDTRGLRKSDVVIDFTHPSVILENIKKVASMGKNIVVGTTGWYDQISEVKRIVKQKKIGLIYAQNFSVGANIFFKIVKDASNLFAKFEGYDAYGFEVHHTGKKDSPSGTAVRIAKEILNNFPAKKKLQTEKLDRQIEKDELHFASVRGGRNPGFHQVTFDSIADSITLSHQAHNRTGFAKGAILAAEFIKGKKGLYNFDQVFEGGDKG